MTTAAPEIPLCAPPATMTAAVIVVPGRVQIKEAPTPVPEMGQVLVRLDGCGVCASNVPPWEGKPWFRYPMAPGALGHEGWGEIVAVGGAVAHFAPGERVAMFSQHAYAEYDTADAGAIVRLPTALGDTPFPAEPLGCAMNIVRRSNISAGDKVAIVGAGFLGLLLTQLASAAGARVTVFSRRESTRRLAKQAGAEKVLPPGEPSDDNRLWDVVIEATGKQEALDLAGKLTRERGRLVVAGYHQDGPRQIDMQLWNWRGLDVINAHERDPQVYLEGMSCAVEAVLDGTLQPDSFYTHQMPLAELGEALTLCANRPDGFVKALVLMR